MTQPVGAIPSQMLRGLDRVLLDCQDAPANLKQPLCAAIAEELTLRVHAPVTTAGEARASDMVVHVRAHHTGTASNSPVELAMWLSRPAGRNGEPAVRPKKTVILQVNSALQQSELRAAVAPTVQAMLGNRAMQRAPSPPRSD